MMSGTSEPKTVATRVIIEETYEFLWKISNWDVIKDDQEARERQTFLITTTGSGGDLLSEWIGGIKNYEEEEYGIYCKLRKVTSTKSEPRYKIDVHFVTELRMNSDHNGEVYWTDEHYETVSVGNSIEVENRWYSDSDWTDLLDEGTNAVSINIKLTVLNPVTTLEGDNAAKATKFRLVCDDVAELSLATLLKSNFSEPDVKIVCSDGKELKCHKFVLQKSPVFEKMLDPKSGFTESSSGIINVKDFGSQSMEHLLHYLYTGDLTPSWKDSDVVVEFTYAAHKYGLSKVMDYLDNALGVSASEKTPSAQHLMVLLDVSIQLELKKAENRIRNELIRLTVSKMAVCKSSKELLEFLGGDT